MEVSLCIISLFYICISSSCGGHLKTLTPGLNVTNYCWSDCWINIRSLELWATPVSYDNHVSQWVPLPISSAYQVVVVEEDGSRQVKRRELGTADCFPTPNSHNGPQAKGAPHYYTAELVPSSLPEATPFTVGDNHTYNGYWNSPLDPTKNYLIYFQATSNFRGVRTIKMPDNAFVSGAQTGCFFVWATVTINLDLCQASQN